MSNNHNLDWIFFSCSESYYVVPIENAKEIFFADPVIPYPEKKSGHLGIVNFRGEVLPVLALGKKNQKTGKFIVLEFEKNKNFCLQVNHVKKIVLDYQYSSVVKIGDHIASVLSSKDFSDGESSWIK